MSATGAASECSKIIIFRDVDVTTILNFRRVNRRSYQVVDSLVAMETINKHLPSLLPLLLRNAAAAPRITAGHLVRKLNQNSCDGCGNPAAESLDLLPVERWCTICRKQHRFQIIHVADAMRPQREAVAKLPIFTDRVMDNSTSHPSVPIGHVRGTAPARMQ